MDLGIYIIIAALIGAKLLLFIVDFDAYKNSPAEILSLVRSGGVFYGGLILAVAVAFWYIPRHKMPLWTTCDVFAPGIALGHVTGRLGCFAAGCCYGKPTGSSWGVIFTNPLSQVQQDYLGVRLHPTQLYEAGAELLILVLLLTTERKGRHFPGRTFWSYMFLYAISRYVIEIYRGDPRGVVPGLDISTSQFISLVLGPLSLIMLAWLSRTVPTSPQGARHRHRVAV
jgi:phosphatidylglycerol:prolipoprotein diacylglycerol transferase